jgi:peptide/nickel transport system substrate-binding protein
MTGNYWDRILSQRIKRRRTLALSGSAALGGLLLACGGDKETTVSLNDSGDPRKPGAIWSARNDWKLEDETKQAVRGGIYRSVMNADQAGNYDAMTQAPSQVPFSDHVHEFLMGKHRGIGVDPQSKDAEVPVPALASALEFVGDGLTATFTMRQGVKWHPVAPVNGRVMDMEDWKSSLERFLKSSPQAVPLNDVLDHAEFPDATHMVWKLKYPFAPLLASIWSERFGPLIMPKELNADPKLAQQVSIGTGYKVLDKNQPSVAMEYRKHAEYWGGDPFIDRWHAPIIPEYANRYAQFVSGNIIDFLPTAQDVLLLHKDVPNAVIVAQELPDDRVARIRFGRNNQKTLPWKDPRVRVAIRRSIDFKRISEVQSNKAAFEAAGIPVEIKAMTHLPQNATYWLDPEKNELGNLSQNYIYDIAEAKKLNAAAGFPNAIPIDYTTLLAAGELEPLEQLVIDSLSASGTFKVDVTRNTNTVEHRNCRSLGQCDGLVFSSVSDDADHVIYRDYQSMGNTAGEQAYPDPRIDAVAAAQRHEMDPVKRIGYLKDFQKLAAELMPAVPYAHQYTVFYLRWPWLHNHAFGSPAASQTSAVVPAGRPILGGHLQWLDANMPNRDKRV